MLVSHSEMPTHPRAGNQSLQTDGRNLVIADTIMPRPWHSQRQEVTIPRPSMGHCVPASPPPWQP